MLAAIVAALVLLAGLADAATSAITEPATNIGGTHATLNGVVNPEGVEPEECLFEWGESYSGPYTETVACAETPAEIGSGTSPVSVHADITGLKPQGTYYHFRLAVVNSPSETLFGANKYFLTLYDVVTEPPTANTGTRATLAGTVNPEGIEPEECFFEWGETTSYGETVACAETPAEIGSGTSPVPVHADISGLTPQNTRYHFRLVIVDPSETVHGVDKNFYTPNTVVTTAATGITPTEATLNGSVNPDTATITECVFEVGPPKSFGQSIQPYDETLPCVPGPGSITGTSPVAVHADLTGLHAGTTYHYRLKAAYSGLGTFAGSDLTVLASGPVIEASWAEGVVREEATLRAKVNPKGSATTYRFQWGTDTSYGSESAESSAGSGSSGKEVSAFLTGLQPGTAYHWRIVAENANGVNEGPDHVLVTFLPALQNTACPNQVYRYGPGASLPDCRAYEMVSPVDKNGADAIGAIGIHSEQAQSAPSGDKFTFSSYRAFAGSEGGAYTQQYMVDRGTGGWQTEAISSRQGGAFGGIPSDQDEFVYFTPDLSTAWINYESITPLVPSAPAGQRNIYRRDNLDSSYTPVVTSEPPTWEPGVESIFYTLFAGASLDGRHAVFTASDKLTPDAPSIDYHNYETAYEWFEGQLRLVAILPNGEPDPATQGSSIGGGGGGIGTINVSHAISDDGSRIFWKEGNGPRTAKLYVRIDGERTEAVSESVSTQPARFWTAAADGSKAIFTINESGTRNNTSSDLYEFDVETETPTLIAHKAIGVLGASEDASYVYFVSREALASGATEGEPNLYLYHAGSYTFVAKLPDDEEVNPVPGAFSAPVPFPISVEPQLHAARVTPDGRHAAFVSQGSLTGYDNTDSATGERAAEVYLYDAETGKLSCPSCNPSGARPIAGQALGSAKTESGRYLAAASIPPWKTSLYPGRNLSDDGSRLFFEAFDALVPQDTNGTLDVYEWEAPGKGDCTTASPSFSSRNGGCVRLISTGRSDAYSEFVDATPSGNDVFFRTQQSLDPRDPGLIDVYDARVGGGFPQPEAPAACEGDTCESVPPAPGATTPSSSTFHGAGNAVARSNCAGLARRVRRLSHAARTARRRARLLVRRARGAGTAANSRRLRRRAHHLALGAKARAKRARSLSGRAKRCRRAERRTGR